MHPGARIDGYELTGEIARGAFGSVHRARDPTGREFALKLLRGRADARTRERFLREGQATAALDHPGIVRVHGCGEHQGSLYLVYELVEGGTTLRDAFKTADLEARVRWVRDAAAALGHAHRQGVIHRDVKPSNLLIDPDGRLLVADFGLVLNEDEERLTKTGEMLGTPAYMAPEQVDGRKHDMSSATDVWALGVILYEALTGGPPFEGNSMLQLGANILSETPAPPSRRGAPRAFDAVCARALSKDRLQRYPDGAAFAAALDAALAGEGPRARAPLPALLAGAALLLLIGAVAFLAADHAPPPPPEAPSPPSPPSQPEPELRLEDARRALLEGNPAQALEALAALPEDETVSGLRATAHVSLGQTKEAEALLALLDRRTGERLRGFAALVDGDLREAGRWLKAKQDVAAVDLERARVELEAEAREAASLLTRVDRDGLLERTESLGARAADVLAPLGPLSLALRRRLTATVVEAVLVLGGVFQHGENILRLDKVLLTLLELCPQRTREVNTARAWTYYADGLRARHPKVRELAQADPRPELERIDERLHGIALGLFYLTSPEPRRELRSLANDVMGMTLPMGQDRLFRCDLLAGLCLDHRAEAWPVFRRGDVEEGRRLLQPALEHAASMVLQRSVIGRNACLQAVLCFLLAGDVGRAKTFLANVNQDRPTSRFIRAQIQLAEGKPRDALASLSQDPPRYQESLVATAHCLLLLGERTNEIPRLIAQAKASNAQRAWAHWHDPAGWEELKAGAWWPGKR